MAKIVFAAGTSHTPMLLAADETLPRFAETDQKMKHRDKEGRPVTYGDLLEKVDPGLAHLVAPENLVARQNIARAAVRRLRTAVSAAALDAVIVFGDDQNESYLEDCRPISRSITATPSATATPSTPPIRTYPTGTSATAPVSSSPARRAITRSMRPSPCI